MNPVQSTEEKEKGNLVHVQNVLELHVQNVLELLFIVYLWHVLAAFRRSQQSVADGV
jgi:hypothetical protein